MQARGYESGIRRACPAPMERLALASARLSDSLTEGKSLRDFLPFASAFKKPPEGGFFLLNIIPYRNQNHAGDNRSAACINQ
ncbi:hypothetical protein INH39_19845 [Massilia violaceinigra]|uniref:Uncharacterized protein n=1 Tax=Massilia violaceinigra TaxID=2045208 RepID=A0ABY3ZZG4_9BURK|nr:hypothetical protein [Massilia violaceinigra]UOD27747.1 hypothetical protein INH39_19845 [Massilia violaceinigra]